MRRKSQVWLPAVFKDKSKTVVNVDACRCGLRSNLWHHKGSRIQQYCTNFPKIGAKTKYPSILFLKFPSSGRFTDTLWDAHYNWKSFYDSQARRRWWCTSEGSWCTQSVCVCVFYYLNNIWILYKAESACSAELNFFHRRRPSATGKNKWI